MNWKNLLANPPAEDCYIVLPQRTPERSFIGFEIWGWNAKDRTLSYIHNFPSEYRMILYQAITNNMYYINLNDITLS